MGSFGLAVVGIFVAAQCSAQVLVNEPSLVHDPYSGQSYYVHPGSGPALVYTDPGYDSFGDLDYLLDSPLLWDYPDPYYPSYYPYDYPFDYYSYIRGRKGEGKSAQKQQVAYVTGPSIVIDPKKPKEPYFVDPGVGNNAVVILPKRRTQKSNLKRSMMPSKRSQAAIVKGPSIVINPEDGESYFVNPQDGEDALVFFPKKNSFLGRSMQRPSQKLRRMRAPSQHTTEMTGVRPQDGYFPQVSGMLDNVANQDSHEYPGSLAHTFAHQLSQHLGQNGPYNQPDIVLLDLLNEHAQNPDGTPMNPDLAAALAEKAQELKNADEAEKHALAELAQALLDKYHINQG